MNSYESALKPVWNYNLSTYDRPNWFSNQTDYGCATLIFPTSTPYEDIKKAIMEISLAGYAKTYCTNVGGEERDHEIQLVLSSYEDYKIVLRELICGWDLCPLASSYTPSRKELRI